MAKFYITGFLFLFSFFGQAQTIDNSPKVILITLDGLRWQELFSGADEKLITNKKYVDDTTALKNLFWDVDAIKRRKKLMPFVWTTLNKIGQIHGNRDVGNYMNLTNKHWFSYPGYNEILTGKADEERIKSNDKIPNPNKTILEIVNADERYTHKVGAFGSWDVFPFIVNEDRSNVLVNAGFENAKRSNLSLNDQFLNKLQKSTPSPWSTVRLDVFTHHYALEYLKTNKPNLVYIAYGETDDFAHDGDYEAYLKATNNTDAFIEELWNFTQNNTFYKNNTTFIITTDHGRGTNPIETWTGHGKNIKGADEVWLIAFGKNVTPIGEIINNGQLYTNQIAPTIAKLFQVDIKNADKNLKLNTK